jgi:hypothetical protein
VENKARRVFEKPRDAARKKNFSPVGGLTLLTLIIGVERLSYPSLTAFALAALKAWQASGDSLPLQNRIARG